MNSTVSPQNVLPNLTAQDLERLIASLPRIENPFEMLAEKYGCDLSAGHYLIVPEWWFLKLPELNQFRATKGVKISNVIETAYLLDGKQLSSFWPALTEEQIAYIISKAKDYCPNCAPKAAVKEQGKE